jgi:calmodulin
MHSLHFSREELAELKEAFALFDKDGSGGITRPEMLAILRDLGEDTAPDVLDPLFRDADVNGDGHLQHKEFLSLVEDLDINRPDHEALSRALVVFGRIRSTGRRT